MTKPRETFHFNPRIQNKGDWMIGLTNLELYNSNFNITEEKAHSNFINFLILRLVVFHMKKSEMKLKDLGSSDITAVDLQDDIIGPIIIDEYRDQVLKRMKVGKYLNILGFYIHSIFQKFESYPRTETNLVEDDNGLVLDEYKSSFITYELEPGINSLKDLSEALFKILRPEYPPSSNEIVFEFNDTTRKTKLVVKSSIIAIRFNERSFFKSILGFTPGWDYKHNNEYTSQKL